MSDVAGTVLLGAALLAAGAGGIATVARLSAAALAAEHGTVSAISYLDRPGDLPDASVRCCGGSKLLFAAAVHRRAWAAGSCFYDSAGIARAHPRLPGFRRPFAVWMHGIEAWEALRPAALAVLRRADRVLVNSRYTLDRFERLHGRLPAARVCWLATEPGDEPAPLADFARPPVVLMLGRLDAEHNYKGHREAIEAWPAVVAAVPTARLVIAGGGTGLELIRRAAAASPAADSIEVVGFVPQPEIPALWRRASVFALPSRKEGFGLVYVEAMRQGIPVVASIHDAGHEVNVDGETGFNVDLDRQGELAERLVALLRDRDLRARMGLAGQRRWREHFTFERFRERLAYALAPG